MKSQAVATLPPESAPRANASPLPCLHCGAPTDVTGLSDSDAVFCCQGCASVYQVIHGLGLEDFYQLKSSSHPAAAGQFQQQSRYDCFDDGEFLGNSAPVELPDGSCETTLAVHGLHCAACSWLIENAAARVPGILQAQVRFNNHTVQIRYDPNRCQLSRIARQLDQLGYQLAPFDSEGEERFLRQSRQLLIKIAVAGFLAGNAMLIGLAFYSGASLAHDYGYLLHIVGTALGVASVLGPGRTFLIGAVSSIRTGTPHMDLPVALGLTAGSVVGVINAWRGDGPAYFDSLAVLVFLLLIGRWIQFRQQQRALKTVELMMRLTPRHALRVSEKGDRQRVLSSALVPGDLVEVLAGDCIPADGVVAEGHSQLDRSLLTGESIPTAVREGESIAAGEVNLDASILMRVQAIGKDSRVGKMMQSVEAAVAEKTPTVLLADRIGGYFVVIVTLLAVGTFAYWSNTNLTLATSHATSLLIVACPCALALATPLAIAVGLGRAAKLGVIIRRGDVLQQLSKPGRIWFDKTGTLTVGKQRVTTFTGPSEALGMAAALERHCKHPIADAIVREAKQRNLEIPEEVELLPKQNGGILGWVDGTHVAVGSLQFMECAQIVIPTELREQSDALAQSGQSPLIIALREKAVSLLGLSDKVRANAKNVIRQLIKKGWTPGILSGDRPEIVAGIAQQLDLPQSECFGGLSPEEKQAFIREAQTQFAPVVMIGDGANDAAALASADVGIAVRGGADVSLQAAPIFVSTGRLQTLLDLISGSSRTTRLIQLAFGISLSYNLVAVAMAFMGYITPLIAAILMPLSSVSVLAVTLATRTFEESKA